MKQKTALNGVFDWFYYCKKNITIIFTLDYPLLTKICYIWNKQPINQEDTNMKFTTNLERYLFAKVCQANANRMWKFSLQKESKYPEGSNKNVKWHNSAGEYLHQSNFWAKVAERFEDAAFEGISKGLERSLVLNGMIPRKGV